MPEFSPLAKLFLVTGLLTAALVGLGQGGTGWDPAEGLGSLDQAAGTVAAVVLVAILLNAVLALALRRWLGPRAQGTLFALLVMAGALGLLVTYLVPPALAADERATERWVEFTAPGDKPGIRRAIDVGQLAVQGEAVRYRRLYVASSGRSRIVTTEELGCQTGRVRARGALMYPAGGGRPTPIRLDEEPATAPNDPVVRVLRSALCAGPVPREGGAVESLLRATLAR